MWLECAGAFSWKTEVAFLICLADQKGSVNHPHEAPTSLQSLSHCCLDGRNSLLCLRLKSDFLSLQDEKYACLQNEVKKKCYDIKAQRGAGRDRLHKALGASKRNAGEKLGAFELQEVPLLFSFQRGTSFAQQLNHAAADTSGHFAQSQTTMVVLPRETNTCWGSDCLQWSWASPQRALRWSLGLGGGLFWRANQAEEGPAAEGALLPGRFARSSAPSCLPAWSHVDWGRRGEQQQHLAALPLLRPPSLPGRPWVGPG